MNNFEYWLNDIADMPMQDENGRWYDAETGIAYNPDAHYRTGGKTTRWAPSEDTKAHRQVAKYYGGKVLSGSQKQKVWGESIRALYLTSDILSDEQKQELATCGGFTESAKFWIENRNVAIEKMTARNIVAQYRGLKELEEKHYEFLVKTNTAHDKNARRNEIKAYLAGCDFVFACDLIEGY